MLGCCRHRSGSAHSRLSVGLASRSCEGVCRICRLHKMTAPVPSCLHTDELGLGGRQLVLERPFGVNSSASGVGSALRVVTQNGPSIKRALSMQPLPAGDQTCHYCSCAAAHWPPSLCDAPGPTDMKDLMCSYADSGIEKDPPRQRQSKQQCKEIVSILWAASIELRTLSTSSIRSHPGLQEGRLQCSLL